MPRLIFTLVSAAVLGLCGERFAVQSCAAQQDPFHGDALVSQNVQDLPPTSSLTGLMTGLYSSGHAQPKFLCFGGMDPKRRESIISDTRVFDHLLKQNLPNQPSRFAMGVNIHPAGDNAAYYVDGSGLILIYCVEFPVSSFTEQDESTEKTEESEKLSAWDKARQELEAGEAGRFARVTSPYGANSSRLVATGTGFQPALAYDEDLVEKLNEGVTAAISQAGNFQALNSNDSVTIYIYGPSGRPNERTVYAWQAKVADAGSDKLIPDSKIERKQYREADSAAMTQLPR